MGQSLVGHWQVISMSRSLMQAFGNMTVRCSPSVLSSTVFDVVALWQQVASLQHPQMLLTSPPDSNGRICYYGYEVTLKWLLDYSKTHHKDYEGYDDSSLIGGAIYLLKAHSGIRTLKYHSALINNTVPPDKNIEGLQPGEQMVPILSIFSSKSYKKRPNQVQVDTLTQIMGRQPMWWIGL
jgi:hypothetical protein